MGIFSTLLGIVGRATRPKGPGKPFHLPRKPSKAEAMKAWGAKRQPGKGGYVPKHKR